MRQQLGRAVQVFAVVASGGRAYRRIALWYQRRAVALPFHSQRQRRSRPRHLWFDPAAPGRSIRRFGMTTGSFLIAFVSLALCGSLLNGTTAAQAPGPKQATPKPIAPKAKSEPKAQAASAATPERQADSLSVDEVIQLVHEGLSEDLVIAKVKKNGKAFDLSTQQLLQLKKAGASNNLIKVMMNPEVDFAQPAAPGPAPSVAPTPSRETDRKPGRDVVLRDGTEVNRASGPPSITSPPSEPTAALGTAAVSSPTHERLDQAVGALSEMMGTPDKAVPRDLMKKAHCIVVVPGLKRAAFGIGAKYGKGFACCRATSGLEWGAPAAVRVEGGSFGFQIGASSTSVVMLVMNEKGIEKLTRSKFTLGGDASVAAGPVGRSASADTDAYMTAEILSWSRSKGIFAGVALNGATLRQDIDGNQDLYAERLDNRQILMTFMKPPLAVSKFSSLLNAYSKGEELRSGDGAPGAARTSLQNAEAPKTPQNTGGGDKGKNEDAGLAGARRLFITAKSADVGGDAFADKELTDSVSDLKASAAKKFSVIETEGEADLKLVLLGRQYEQVRPTIMRHKTQRTEGILNCALYRREGSEWKPVIKLRAQSLYWKDAASKMIGEVSKSLNSPK